MAKKIVIVASKGVFESETNEASLTTLKFDREAKRMLHEIYTNDGSREGEPVPEFDLSNVDMERVFVGDDFGDLSDERQK